MKKAAMDIGTNSTRLLIAELKEEQKAKNVSEDTEIIVQEIRITRIGEGMKLDKNIKEEPLNRTIKALKEYRQILSEKQVSEYKIVATSAMRDALNKDEVLQRIQDETGFMVEVITGSREAELSYLGAVADFPEKNVVIDIGGGSTEVIYEDRLVSGGDKPCLIFTSTDLGAVRIMENPALAGRMVQLFRESIPDKSLLKGFTLVGVGGTITTIAAINLGMTEYDWKMIHGSELALKKIEEIADSLKALPLAERKKIPGLEPERADIIIHGIDILITFMKEYGFSVLKVSDKDLLFALLHEK